MSDQEHEPTPVRWPPVASQRRYNAELERARLRDAPMLVGRERVRQKLFAAQDGKCHWCGERMELDRLRVTPAGKEKFNPAFATFEHLMSRRNGGAFRPGNIVLAHEACNRNRPSPTAQRLKNHPRYAHDPELPP